MKEYDLDVFVLKGLGWTRKKKEGEETGRLYLVDPTETSWYRETPELSRSKDSVLEFLAEELNRQGIYITKVGQDFYGRWSAEIVMMLAKDDPRRGDDNLYGSWEYSSEGDTPNIALCLAIRRMIIGEKKYIDDD